MVQYESDMLCTKSNQNFRGIRRKVKENVVSCCPCNISYFNSENRFPLGQCGMVSRLLHDAVIARFCHVRDTLHAVACGSAD